MHCYPDPLLVLAENFYIFVAYLIISTKYVGMEKKVLLIVGQDKRVRTE
jgi:hypothetical protein